MGKNKNSSIAQWSTRDLLVVAVISLVFGFITIVLTYFYTMLIVPLGPVAMFSLHGLWFIPPLFVIYIVRRPGSALLCQTIMAIISIPFNTWGWMNLLVIITRGLPLELPFFITRYRYFKIPIMMISSVFTGIVAVLVFWIPLKLYSLSLDVQFFVLISAIINSAIFGLVSKLIGDTIAKSGVLSNYDIGENQRHEI